jgi:tetratricopeptide (TPR) repeat protein
LEKSIAIREQIQVEVDRAFGHTTTILNVLLVLLTSFPILAAAGIWFIRGSVISQIVAETKKQLQETVEKQLEEEVALEFKRQTEAFKQEIERLNLEFVAQLSQLKNLVLDAQTEKDKIIQELSQITPSPVREPVAPEIQQKIQELTTQLDVLKATNPQLFFTANDYVEQGKALYFEGRYDEAIASHDKAIQIEPDNHRAWFSKGAALTKLQQYEEAIASYERANQIKADFSEAWFGRGTALSKLQRYEEAIASYDQVTQIKPDFYLAWFSKSRCYALQGNNDLAIESLQEAIHLNSDKCKEAAKTDPSFDRVREDERFNQLIN